MLLSIFATLLLITKVNSLMKLSAKWVVDTSANLMWLKYWIWNFEIFFCTSYDFDVVCDIGVNFNIQVELVCFQILVCKQCAREMYAIFGNIWIIAIDIFVLVEISYINICHWSFSSILVLLYKNVKDFKSTSSSILNDYMLHLHSTCRKHVIMSQVIKCLGISSFGLYVQNTLTWSSFTPYDIHVDISYTNKKYCQGQQLSYW